MKGINMKYKVINSFKTYSYVLIEAENEKQAKINKGTFFNDELLISFDLMQFLATYLAGC